MTKCWTAGLALWVLLGAASGPAADRRVLVYTRNFVTGGGGYVHDNIQSSVDAIRKMGAESGFKVDVSDNPEVFTDASLKQYRVLIFSNSNNEAFANDRQRDAFRHFIQAGGGFVGIHSASGSERNWPYFWSVLGGKFLRHPPFQKFTVRVTDPKHPATRNLPATFEWADECYYHEHLSSSIRPLLVTDPSHLNDPQKGGPAGDRVEGFVPLAWYQELNGGRQFYTSLGHRKEDYASPILYSHILGGILWAMGEK